MIKPCFFFILFISFKGDAMQCLLDGVETRKKKEDIGNINIETIDGFYKGSVNGNIGSVGSIKCDKPKPQTHGRNIRIESVKSHGNICFTGRSSVRKGSGTVETRDWNSNISKEHTVFKTERGELTYRHTGTNYTLTACDPAKKIIQGSYEFDVMLFSWQRVGGVKGYINYRLKVNVKDKENKAVCNISNKGNARMLYGELSAGTGEHQKHYDAQISCNMITSFSYKLRGATPQINTLPSVINNDTYLGVGLGVINGTLWVSTVNNSPLKLSGRLNSADTGYLRINSKVNTAPRNIKDTGGGFAGSAILEITAD